MSKIKYFRGAGSGSSQNQKKPLATQLKSRPDAELSDLLISLRITDITGSFS